MKKLSAELCVDCRDSLGEGLFWDNAGQRLYWVDIGMPSRLHSCDASGLDHRIWPMSEMISYAVPRASGGLLVASHGGLSSLDLNDGQLRPICPLEPMRPFNRSNDACCDPMGRRWVGTMQNNIAPDGSDIAIAGNTGSLYRVGSNMETAEVISNIGIANSACFAPDGKTMYFCDTLQEVIWQFPFDAATGHLGVRSDFARHEVGSPDGSTTDADGGVWNARFNGSCVVRFAPDGRPDTIVDVPTSEVTCCTFGGPNLDTLYITTKRLSPGDARIADEPHSGSLFAVQPGIAGLPDVPFAG